MVSAGDFRNGLTIEIDGTVYQVIDRVRVLHLFVPN